MKAPSLTRVDFRLLHGQIVTGWLKKLSINKVMIVDDATKSDPYISMIFGLAKPAEVKLEIMTFAEAGAKWKENGLGIRDRDSALVLIKNIAGAKEAFDAGFRFAELQVGTTEGGPGKTVVGVICLDEQEAKDLSYLSDNGVKVYFQSNCDSRPTPWDTLKAKHFPAL